MSNVQLNLARKWRAQRFEQIVGQDIVLKLLKNSLYRGQLFPVYLFWGQYGTGKTSIARVFAAAINCQKLSLFQQDPKKHVVPCLDCASCRAMQCGKHPDFIEIDAASNTGVDQVRQIIEAAALMPLMGHKKIYLIDEAHMLSKAAFNAFLKILEEPPISALFMLATTDLQKILETVRSRCFQLCLKPVDSTALMSHIRAICKQESISASADALTLIVNETEGSVRDAINLLERVRFVQGRVTSDAILRVLGYIDDARLIQLIEHAVGTGGSQLLQFLHDLMLEQCTPEYIWRRVLELTRMALWASYGLAPKIPDEQAVRLMQLARSCPRARFVRLLELFCSYERLFLKTHNKRLLLEMILLKVWRSEDSGNEPTMNPLRQQVAVQSIPSDEDDELIDDDEEQEEEEDEAQRTTLSTEKAAQTTNGVATNDADHVMWDLFITKIESLNDPLLISIFKQGAFVGFDRRNSKISLCFARQFAFFSEWLENTVNAWQSLLDEVCKQSVTLDPSFTGELAVAPVMVNESRKYELREQVKKGNATSSCQPSTRPFCSRRSFKQAPVVRRKVVNVTDADTWPMANLLLHYFPGIVREG